MPNAERLTLNAERLTQFIKLIRYNLLFLSGFAYRNYPGLSSKRLPPFTLKAQSVKRKAFYALHLTKQHDYNRTAEPYLL